LEHEAATDAAGAMNGRFYVVGGAVRDTLLGLPAQDRDWVAVGCTPQDLLDAGYRPVGKDFPVFLHPQTGEEVALARTERKSAPGYHGFSFHAAPDVTLEQDLARRDLTINAMAFDADGRLIDPHGGQADLQAGVLRHVGPAFVEDPVRLLRLARLAARFPAFTVAPETAVLLREMVDAGEVDALVPERVWQELSRGLMERQPGRFFEVLRGCGALRRLLPEVDRLWGVPQPPEHHPEVDTGVHLLAVLAMCARLAAPLAVRWACVCHDLGKGTTPPDELPRHRGHEQRSARLAHALAERLRVPRECRELADVVAREHGNVHGSGRLDAAALLRLLERCDALRRPARFADVLLACECDARGRHGLEDRDYPQRPRLAAALALALAVDTAAVAADAAARGLGGPAVGAAVHAARVRAVAEGLAGWTGHAVSTSAGGGRPAAAAAEGAP
jgi:tRNA nucleotidyltransferase (CCA-adding enzyme)